MLKRVSATDRDVLGRGVYGTAEAVKLLNFEKKTVQREQSIAKRLRAGFRDMTIKSAANEGAPIRSGDLITPMMTTRSS